MTPEILIGLIVGGIGAALLAVGAIKGSAEDLQDEAVSEEGTMRAADDRWAVLGCVIYLSAMLASFMITGGLIYVAWHFVRKFW